MPATALFPALPVVRVLLPAVPAAKASQVFYAVHRALFPAPRKVKDILPAACQVVNPAATEYRESRQVFFLGSWHLCYTCKGEKIVPQ